MDDLPEQPMQINNLGEASYEVLLTRPWRLHHQKVCSSSEVGRSQLDGLPVRRAICRAVPSVAGVCQLGTAASALGDNQALER